MRSRPFVLPHVALAQVLPGAQSQVDRMYRIDHALLQAMPVLDHFAGVRVIELTK
jgi:hypothetical protein